MKFSTKAIHVAQSPDPTTGAITSPIYQTTAFVQDEPGFGNDYAYARFGNPNQKQLEEVMASLEEGAHGFTFTSGTSALTTLIMATLKSGDHVIAGDDVYGGTYLLLTQIFEKFGIAISYVDTSRVEAVKDAIHPHTKMIFLETPTNPMLKLTDIRAVSDIAKAHDLITVVDNTFASPYLQQPLKLGADMVMHSMTKYIGGHSDVVGGALVLKDDTYSEAIHFHQKGIGATQDPFSAWLTLRGLKTLEVRMQAHIKNASTLAEALMGQNGIDSVIYPGLKTHPQYQLASQQMAGPGGMISIRIKGDPADFVKHLKFFKLAVSLGGIESLIQIPALMSHRGVPPETRQKLGITDNLIRLSVGIEDKDDLKDDLLYALMQI